MAVKRSIRQSILEHILGKTDIGVLPTGMGLALYTAAPTAAGTGGTEVASANGYARTSYPGTKWDAATAAEPSVIDNAAQEDIGPASGGAWGTIVGVAITSGTTHGVDDIIAYLDLTVDVTINDGDTLRIAAGAMSLSLGNV